MWKPDINRIQYLMDSADIRLAGEESSYNIKIYQVRKTSISG